MLEAPNNFVENFKEFKKRMQEKLDNGNSLEELRNEIYSWQARKQIETGKRGGTISERVLYQIELAELYIIIGDRPAAREVLEDALLEAENDPNSQDLVEKILNLIDSIQD